ncbi:hypothetical protein ACJZ2D_000887 [Fusarium nematophilum]
MPDSTLPKPFPASVIIIGAGVFGLSTALAISNRHSPTQVTVIDRLTPPAEDGTSVDTTRCIRSDYTDPIYTPGQPHFNTIVWTIPPPTQAIDPPS